MSTEDIERSGPASPTTVCVTVAAGGRRLDLALPAELPVAELVPGLARTLGVLDARTANGGFRLATVDGRALLPGPGLAEQGVRPGHVVILETCAEEPPPKRYDDEAEAMADVAEERALDGTARLTGWAVVASAAATGVIAVWSAVPSGVRPGLLAGCATGLVAAAARVSRRRTPVAVMTLLAGSACVTAAVAGASLGADDAPRRIAYAGAASVLVGAVAAVGTATGRLLVLLPSWTVGSALLAAGLGASRLPMSPGFVVVALVGLVTVAAERLPSLALAACARHGPGRHAEAPVDVAQLRAWARSAEQVVVAGSLSVAALLVLAAPFAVTSGGAGALTAFLCAALMLLSSRGRRGPPRRVGMAGGLVGLLATAVSALCLQPGWRPGVAAAAFAVAAGGLAAERGLRIEPLLVERFCETGRAAALVALPSVLLVTSGATSALAR